MTIISLGRLDVRFGADCVAKVSQRALPSKVSNNRIPKGPFLESKISAPKLNLELYSSVHLTLLHMHLDPDFDYLTYGDQGERARQLSAKIGAKEDIIAFYAGLKDVRDKRLIYAYRPIFRGRNRFSGKGALRST